MTGQEPSEKTPVHSLQRQQLTHDLNNALTVIVACADAMHQHVPQGRADHAYAEIQRAAARASRIALELLTFGPASIVERGRHDINRFVLQHGGLLLRLLGSTISLRMQLTSQATVVRAEPTELEAILVSLVLNARDAMPDGGIAAIETGIVDGLPSGTEQETSRASHAGPFVRLTVDDTASGTTRDASSRVSARSRTPIESTRESGLPAVRAAVRQLSGVLRLERRDGGGTRVSVFIPRAGHSTV
jgi:two-component system, cell cycle sensor histidine kinase and response regulator CckA